MGAFYIMITISLIIAVGFLSAFMWSVKKGHFDDDYTPSVRILLDDTTTEEPTNK
jgi:cbb3-type cytochrome oxidase maturation protein